MPERTHALLFSCIFLVLAAAVGIPGQQRNPITGIAIQIPVHFVQFMPVYSLKETNTTLGVVALPPCAVFCAVLTGGPEVVVALHKH